MTDVLIWVDGDEKYIFLPNDDKSYRLVLTGTDEGEMYLGVQETDMSTGTLSDEISFENVSLSAGKTMLADIGGAADTPDVQLFIIDGIEMLGEIMPDGSEITFDHPAPLPAIPKPPVVFALDAYA
jgi:hypothetical protein